MGTNSDIEWTHHTFNPWWGCQRVSPVNAVGIRAEESAARAKQPISAAAFSLKGGVMWKTRDMFDDEPIDPVAAFWTAERRALLGTDTDANIAKRLGTTILVVFLARLKFNVTLPKRDM